MAFVVGFAEDDGWDACCFEGEDVLCAAYASAGDEVAQRVSPHDAAVEVDGRACECAVAAYLCAEHVLRACLHVSEQEVFEQYVGVFLPSVDGDASVPYVCSEDEAFCAVLCEPAEIAFRLGDGDASCRHHGCSGFEGFLQVFVGLDAAAEIDDEACLRRDGLQRGEVHHMLAFRAVQIDYMQAAKPHVLEPTGHLKRVAIDLLRVVVAFGQTHALAFDDVYCRNQFHLAFTI